jgi:hypothetical protein
VFVRQVRLALLPLAPKSMSVTLTFAAGVCLMRSAAPLESPCRRLTAEEKADLRHAIYERIVVAGPEIVRVRLTSAAYADGLTLALPEQVAMARQELSAPYRSRDRRPDRCETR